MVEANGHTPTTPIDASPEDSRQPDEGQGECEKLVDGVARMEDKHVADPSEDYSEGDTQEGEWQVCKLNVRKDGKEGVVAI